MVLHFSAFALWDRFQHHVCQVRAGNITGELSEFQIFRRQRNNLPWIRLCQIQCKKTGVKYEKPFSRSCSESTPMKFTKLLDLASLVKSQFDFLDQKSVVAAITFAPAEAEYTSEIQPDALRNSVLPPCYLRWSGRFTLQWRLDKRPFDKGKLFGWANG